MSGKKVEASALPGEVWRGTVAIGGGPEEPLVVRIVDGSPVVFRPIYGSAEWCAAAGAREVYALRAWALSERARADQAERDRDEQIEMRRASRQSADVVEALLRERAEKAERVAAAERALRKALTAAVNATYTSVMSGKPMVEETMAEMRKREADAADALVALGVDP